MRQRMDFELVHRVRRAPHPACFRHPSPSLSSAHRPCLESHSNEPLRCAGRYATPSITHSQLLEMRTLTVIICAKSWRSRVAEIGCPFECVPICGRGEVLQLRFYN